jgi:hypothetical protein
LNLDFWCSESCDVLRLLRDEGRLIYDLKRVDWRRLSWKIRTRTMIPVQACHDSPPRPEAALSLRPYVRMGWKS